MNDLNVGRFIDEVISGGVTDVDDLYLEHHGVKGMKWGVRKDLSSGNSLAKQKAKAAKKESSEESSETEYTITSMDASKADKFTVKTKDTSMSFSKTGDNWVYDDDKTVELDQTKMSGIVSSLYNSSSTIKIVNPSDLEQYGLGDGAMEIELSSGTTKTKLTLGSFNQMISKFYIMKDGDKAVYAITGDELSNLSGGIDSLKAAADTSTSTSTAQ